ncbi:CdiA family toxin C-terminal domain-containing protein [Pseudomonas cichorii]|nr:CdiA family toxin C-terminal domain-containing protein [Pseudomonas cichorii]
MHKGVPISNNARNHLEQADGYSTKTGVKGAHNREEFLQAATDNNLHIISEAQSPKTPGLSAITYGRDSLDRTGQVVGVKQFGNPKTVYDPNVISTDKMFEAGKEAAASGYSQAKASGNRVYSASHDGIEFRIYLDETLTTVTNFHPTMK